ncbi:MAG: right-handed parallel beta-helix repeat-containing protein [Elusimicrobia bacterium]|nr:right-handed parallel beta-helix repeat-containing protein [Elusimicrobiota bacterium]
MSLIDRRLIPYSVVGSIALSEDADFFVPSFRRNPESRIFSEGAWTRGDGNNRHLGNFGSIVRLLILFIFYALTSASLGQAASVPSAQSGLWSSTSTWQSASIPADNDVITIAAGHSVTLNQNVALSTVSIYGTLKWDAATASATLTLNSGNINVYAGGTLQMGTPEAPLATAATAAIVLGQNTSVVVNDGGNFVVRGSTKNPYALGQDNVVPGATSFRVNTSSVTGWAAGDVLSISQNERDGKVSRTETITIGSIDAANGIVSPASALSYYHYSTNTIVVANLTRNASIKASVLNTAFLKSLAVNTSSFYINFGEFGNLGLDASGADSKYGVSLASAGTTGVIQNSSFHDGWYGLALNGSTQTLVAANVFAGNRFTGLGLLAVSNSTAAANVIHTSSHGVASSLSNGIVITGNYVYSSTHGVTLLGDSGGIVAANRIFSNQDALMVAPSTSAVISASNLVANNTLFYNSGYGLYVSSSTRNTIDRNSAYSNGSYGFYAAGASSNSFTGNVSAGNSNYGFYVTNSSSNTFSGNVVSSNTDAGFYFQGSSGSLLQGNTAYPNSGVYSYGFYLANGSNANLLEGNVAMDIDNKNNYAGFYLLSSSNNIVSGNHSSGNSYGLVSFAGTNNTFSGNSVECDFGYGLEDQYSHNTFIVGNDIDGCYEGMIIYKSTPILVGNWIHDGSIHLYVTGSTATIADSALGYDRQGNAESSSYQEISLSDNSQLILRNTKVNSELGVSTSSFSKAHRSIISYKHNGNPGEAHLWGDYRVEGSTFALNYAQDLYSSTATTPRIARRIMGTEPSAGVNSVSTMAASELISIVYNAAGGKWNVYGSSSGALGSFTSPISNQPFPPAPLGKFRLTFTQGNSPSQDDRVEFLALSGSNDSGTQKKLSFHSSASGFNGGRSRLGIEPSGVFSASGTASAYTLVDLDAGSTYYTLTSSGSAYASFAKFANLDTEGLQLNLGSPANIRISSVVFDNMGGPSGGGSTAAYVTVRDLNSTVGLDSVRFDLARSTAAMAKAYNIQVRGSDTNLGWTMTNPMGALSGDAWEYDPNAKISWAAGKPTDFRMGSAYVSSATWVWSDVASESAYQIFSSTGGDLSGSLSVNSASWTETGLSTNTQYTRYLRANSSVAPSYSSLISSYTLGAPPTGFALAAVYDSSVTLQWGANTNPNGTVYRLDYWFPTGSTTTMTTTQTSAAVTGLNPSALYSFQLYSVNGDSITTVSTVGIISTTTAISYESGKGGLWSATSTWKGGRVPPASAAVVIASGTTVTLNQDVTVGPLAIYGTLQWASAVASATLAMNGGDVTINAGGMLQMGNQNNPLILGTTATIVLSSGSTLGQYGLIVNPGGRLITHGAVKSPFTAASVDVAAGAAGLTVDASSVTNWAAGDTIIVEQTSGGSVNQTERRTITSISGSAISVGSAFSYTHYATAGVIVANLTRNAVIRSSGAQTGYIRNLAVATTDFSVAGAQLEGLGTPASGKYGLTFDGASVKGRLNASSLVDCYIGIVFDGTSNVRITSNVIVGSALVGLDLFNGASSNTITGNVIASGSRYGIFMAGASNNTFTDNYSFSNVDSGWTLDSSSGNYIQRGYAVANGGSGFSLLNADFNTFDTVGANANVNSGLHLSGGSSNSIVSANFYDNGAYGVYFQESKSGALAAGNLYSNGNSGLFVSGGEGTSLTQVASYGNKYGLEVSGSTVDVISSWLGFTPSLTGWPNMMEEVRIGAGSSQFFLYDTRLNPEIGVATDSWSAPGRHLLSLRHQGKAGEAHLWGDLTVQSSTMSLDYSRNLYYSTAAVVRMMRKLKGTDPVVVVSSVSDIAAFSEIVMASYTAASNRWSLYGSSSGALGYFSNAGALTNEPFPSASASKFLLTFTPGSSASDGDRWEFSIRASAGDSNQQKKLYFHNASSGFNGGRSRLTVPPGSGLLARGTLAEPTLLDRVPGGAYYTLISSGATTLIRSKISGLEPSGLQLGGASAVVNLSSSAFDGIGISSSSSSTATYITAQDLSSSATFYDMIFTLSQATSAVGAAYNVAVLGSDSSLNWYFSRPLGSFGGESYDYDPNNKVAWSMINVDSLSGAAATASTITWSWSDSDSETGYRIVSSTDGSLSGNLSANTTYWAEAGLSTNTAYSRRLVTFNNLESSSSSLTTLYTLAAPPTGFMLLQAGISSVTLQWGANSNPAGTSYSLAYWTMNGATSTVSSSVTSASITSLSYGTTYFFQVYAVNGDSVSAVSLEAALSTATISSETKAPASFSGSAAGISSITWRWTDVEGESSFRVLSSTDGVLSGDLSAGTTYWSETGLSTGTAYTRRILTVTSFGSSQSANASVYTLAAPPSKVSFQSVSPSSLTVSWNANTNPAAINYAAALWSTGGSTTTASAIAATTAAFTGLNSATTYFVTVKAINGDNLSSRPTTAVSTVTTATTRSTTISDYSATTVITYQTDAGSVTVTVPGQSFSQSVSLTISQPLTYPEPASPTVSLTSTTVGIEVSASPDLRPNYGVKIAIPYPASSVSGLDVNKLILARYDSDSGVWVPLSSRLDTTNRIVTGCTDHFSTFEIMQASPASSLDSVKTFPNPCNAAKGHRAFTFANLPADTAIKIYTLVGELVEETAAGSSGIATWDTTNAAGANVASGVYFALLEAPSGDHKVVKVVVQR